MSDSAPPYDYMGLFESDVVFDWCQSAALVVSVEVLVLVPSDFHVEFNTFSDLGNGNMTFWSVLRKNL